MLISKENTGKSKYTLEFHSLLGAPLLGESPRDEQTRWRMKRTRRCEERTRLEGKKGSPTLGLLSQSLFILFGADVLQPSSRQKLSGLLDGLDILVLRSSSKPLVRRETGRVSD